MPQLDLNFNDILIPETHLWISSTGAVTEASGTGPGNS